MSDVWSDRAQLYRESAAHREGPDLDLLVRVGRGVQRKDGARRRHRRRPRGPAAARDGVNVVTTDAAPGMQPDVITRAEHLRSRTAASTRSSPASPHHHFEDPQAATGEMARVSGGLVVVVDNLFMSDEAEEADKLRDPSHVRNYTEDEWRAMFEEAGLEVEGVEHFDKPIEFQPWLDRVGCDGADADARPRAARRPHRGRLGAARAHRAQGTEGADGDRRRQRHAPRRPGPDRPRGLVPRPAQRAYGTQVVAGVTPGKGGQDVEGIPVFDTVAEAVDRDRREHGDGLRARALRRPTRSTRRSTRASPR